MALELKAVSAEPEEESGELRDMTRRFWIGAAFALPVFLLAMAHVFPKRAALGHERRFALDAVHSLHARRAVGGLAVLCARTLHFDMFRLIAIGVGAAYGLQRGGDARTGFP